MCTETTVDSLTVRVFSQHYIASTLSHLTRSQGHESRFAPYSLFTSFDRILPDLTLKSEPFFLDLRFMSLRASHVQILARNPKSKMRHEKVDLELFTRKKEESYIDLKEDRCLSGWSCASAVVLAIFSFPSIFTLAISSCDHPVAKLPQDPAGNGMVVHFLLLQGARAP